MKGIVKGLAAAGLGLALVANTAHAQKPGVELGVNLLGFASINPDGDDNNATVMNIGTASLGGAAPSTGSAVTAAWYLNEMIAIEPALGWGRLKLEADDDATTFMSIGVGVPIYLKKGWGKAGGLFVTPFVGIFRMSAGGADAVSQTHLGANVGTKMRITDNVFWRAQVGFDMGQENDDFAKSTTMGGQFGLNVYLR